MSTPALPLREPSPVDAAVAAFEHTRRNLFPFQFQRWLTLGLAAFLDQCGRGGAGGTGPGGMPPIPGGGSGGDVGTAASDAAAKLGSEIAIIVAVAAGILLVVLALVTLALWIGSRGTFVYLDNVAGGTAEISRPWREHARLAGSYFRWQLALAFGLLFGLLVLVAAGVGLALTVGRSDGGAAVLTVGLVLLVPLVILTAIGAALFSMALRDFVAPLQMATGTACGPALRVLVTLLKAHPVAFLLYVVLKIAFAVVQAVIVFAAMCVTCCCVLIPVVTQTALQPLFFFERSWPLFLLRQMGYDIVGDGGQAAAPLEI